VRGVSDRVDDYDYAFPETAIAHVPSARREDARLMVVSRFAREREPSRPAVSGRSTVSALPTLLRSGDLLVVNDVAVLAAKLVARRHTGGRVSVLVLEVGQDARTATVLLGTRGTLLEGEELELHGDRWRVNRVLGEGRHQVSVAAGRDVPSLMADAGRMPLPPYIDRDPVEDARDDLDRERYRTTFGGETGRAVAAPTAGLHLTPELLSACEAVGVRVARVRLDVGEGTFRPLRAERLDDHTMHAEDYDIPAATAQAYAATRAAGGRVVAVGTTVVRSLESAVLEGGASLCAGPGTTRLFLRPGHEFSAVDALLTNFHQPRSTLLVLVSAFAGRRTIAEAYDQAIADGFRLFSYGDAMLLVDDDGAGPGLPGARR
jgi:S-adenosylmethionine:tRNA ribosyltransferase-isomerase